MIFYGKIQKKSDEDIRCPLEYGLAVFGGKWKSRIICVLSANSKLRYSEIRKELYNITDAVLAATLKDLIADGIVDRKSYDEIPPRVEYSLTEKGTSVVPILQSICQRSDIFYKEDVKNEMTQCQKCDYQGQGIAGQMLEYLKDKDFLYIEGMPEDKDNYKLYLR